MSLANQLAALMREHDLVSLDVGILARSDGIGTFWVSSAQAVSGGARLCGQKHGDTPEEAVTRAITELNEKRGGDVAVPTLEAA
jgi:hypothetical protein